MEATTFFPGATFETSSDIPEDPTFEQSFGPDPGSPEFEKGVRESLGAEPPKPRMVSVKPRVGSKADRGAKK